MPSIEDETIRETLNRETRFSIDETVKITREETDVPDNGSPRARGRSEPAPPPHGRGPPAGTGHRHREWHPGSPSHITLPFSPDRPPRVAVAASSR